MQLLGAGQRFASRAAAGRVLQPLKVGLRSVRRRVRQARVATGCLTGLDFLWLEITRGCNLACAHCYADSGPDLPVSGRMSLGDWQAVLQASRTEGCRRVQFIGGEPTLHPGLPVLLEHAARVGFRYIEVFTNATHLSRELLQCFRRWGVRVASSFYSADPAVHDRITGHPGSFDKTVGGLRRLVEQRIPLRVGLIAVEREVAELRRAKRFLRSLGVRSIDTDGVRGIGRGRQLVPDTQPHLELCGACWQRKLSVDAEGRAYPCVFSRFACVGNVLDEELRSIVSGQALRAFRRWSYLEQA